MRQARSRYDIAAMPAPYWYCFFLLPLSAAGCGRLGVQLLPREFDAGVQPMDAGTRNDAGQLPAAGGSGEGGGGMSGLGSGSGSGAGGGGGGGGGSAVDGGLPYQGDASTMTMIDAATPMPVDAGTPIDAGNPVSCGGARQFDLCWYLAAEDTSCNDECADKGGFDSRALAYVGTENQGGSELQCEQVLTAVGRPGTVAIGTQQIGLGCHLWNNGDRWWLQSPAFSANAATPQGTGARIACACSR